MILPYHYYDYMKKQVSEVLEKRKNENVFKSLRKLHLKSEDSFSDRKVSYALCSYY